MHLDEIRAILARVTYRPGWTVNALPHPFGSYVLIDAEVLDSEKWDDNYTVDVNYRLGNITRIGVRACVPPWLSGQRDFMNWLSERMQKVERHECREFLMLDGKPWDSPHKVKQAKHDFHVRKLPWGKWGVIGHGAACVVCFGGELTKGDNHLLEEKSSMYEAFIAAINWVVNEDLGKGTQIVNG